MTFRTLHRELVAPTVGCCISVGLLDVPVVDQTWISIWGDMGDA